MLCYVRFGDRLVDPRRAGQLGRPGAAGEAPRVRGAGRVEHGLAFFLDRGRGADVHRVRGVQPYPGMAVLVVVIGEERAAERAGVLERPECPGECRAVLQRLELRLAVRVVVALTGQYPWGYPLAG
jgi:hypothetical protein